MKHLIILLLLFSILSSAASITIYALIYRQQQKKAVKAFIIIQALLFFNAMIDLFTSYNAINIKNINLWESILYHEALFIWSSLISYYIITFFCMLTGTATRVALKIFRLAVFIIPLVCCLIPFVVWIVSGSLPLMVNVLGAELDAIANPLVFSSYLLAAFISGIRYKKIKNMALKSILRLFLLYSLLFLPLVFFALFIMDMLLAATALALDLIPVFNAAALIIWNSISICLVLIKDFHAGLPALDIVTINSAQPRAGLPGYKGRYEKSKLTYEESEKLLNKLNRLIEQKKPFLDPGLTITGLAAMLDITRNNLSQLINQYKGMNFNNFINYLRVEEAKALLKNDHKHYGNILNVAFEVGFNTKATFYSAFKKFTGRNPLEYKKIV